MSDGLWKVITEGTPAEGYSQEQAIAGLITLLKLSPANAQRLLQGREVVVKKDISKATASVYQQKLYSAGVNVRIQRHDALDSPVNSTAAERNKDKPKKLTLSHSDDHSTEDYNNKFCPKCSKPRANGNECPHCGIFYTKYIEGQAKQNDIAEQALRQEEQNRRPKVEHPPLPWFRIGTGIAIVAAILLSRLSYFNPPDFSLIGQSAKAQAAAWAMHNNIESHHREADTVKEHLADKDFIGLEQIIADIEQTVQVDITKEWSYYAIYNNIINSIESETLLDEWVAATGSSYAYAARGIWYTSKGADVRGTCFARCVTEAQFVEHARLTKIGLKDLRLSLDQNAKLLPVYLYLITASSARGVRIDLKSTLDQSIEQYPANYYIRDYYLDKLKPRWGGSHAKMERFAEEQQEYFEYNPRLYTLLGESYADQAWYAKSNDACPTAIKLLRKAIGYGITSHWADSMAWCLAETGQTLEALDFAKLALNISESEKRQDMVTMLEQRAQIPVLQQLLSYL
ncbi:hypothetical protein EDC56_0120 [Sinobacterium caligoides]|uniref:Uncharacterized protein n=1 Tax=Sinobacterium caligoides TaxID=933926 RepID=A0A3N2DXU2_9GAMM|nr:hypothetical protein [Sinobacterium caligoides]ROS04614.1 hypothetical protein EDC56_0120 [Sinobacterium caligoides]